MIPNKSVSALESLLDVDLYTPAPTAAATVSTEQRVMKELKKYMDAGPNGLSCDPFERWSVNACNYPSLSQLAKYCLITPASSLPSKRVFSTAGQIVSARRNRLLPKNVYMLLFLNKNWS